MKKFFQKKFIFPIIGLLLIFFASVFGRKLFFKRKVKREFLPLPGVKINFFLLESEELKELEPFGEIQSFKDEIGRENPFLPFLSKGE